MTFKQNISRLVAGDLRRDSIPTIAISALDEGLDTPSLRILAGLSENENAFLLNTYFQDTLQELKIKLPSKRQAALDTGIILAEEVLEGKVDVFEGVQEIKRRAIDAFPFFEENIQYCYDSIGFENVYGLLDAISDLREAKLTPWAIDKTNEELERELKAKMLAELNRWVEKMKNGS